MFRGDATPSDPQREELANSNIIIQTKAGTFKSHVCDALSILTLNIWPKKNKWELISKIRVSKCTYRLRQAQGARANTCSVKRCLVVFEGSELEKHLSDEGFDYG